MGIQHLQEEGHMPVLGDACIARARALEGREDPDLSFGPVLHWLAEEPVLSVRIEYLLASASYAASVGDRTRAQRYWREAELVFGDLQIGMEPADRAALSIHPWAVKLRRGLRI